MLSADGAHAAVTSPVGTRRQLILGHGVQQLGYAGLVLLFDLAGAAPGQARDNAERIAPNRIQTDLFLTKPNTGYDPNDLGPSGFSSTAPVAFDTSALLIGGLLALAALLLALATQKDKKLTARGGGQPASMSPASARKVRWRLGDSSSDEESNTKARWQQHNSAPANPSWDGCYYMADPVDDAGSPSYESHRTPIGQNSRRFFN